MNISFVNIPAETPDEPLTEYLSQFANIVRNPLHIQKDHDGIPYYTGTRVYQVNRLYQHLPRHINNMFGRSVLCIYLFTTINRQINLEKGITQTGPIITDRGQTDTRPKTKEIPITTTNQMPKVKTNNKTGNKYNNQKQNSAAKPRQIQEQQPQETTNTHQQQRNITSRKAKTTPTTQYHINTETPPSTTQKFKKQHQLKKTNAARPHYKKMHNLL